MFCTAEKVCKRSWWKVYRTFDTSSLHCGILMSTWFHTAMKDFITMVFGMGVADNNRVTVDVSPMGMTRDMAYERGHSILRDKDGSTIDNGK